MRDTRLTKEGIKAIRFCMGYTSDLRVKINNKGVQNHIWDWIANNAIGIFGSEFYSTPAAGSDEWEQYERDIWNAVKQVAEGRAEK